MKKHIIISLFLALTLILTGCSSSFNCNGDSDTIGTTSTNTNTDTTDYDSLNTEPDSTEFESFSESSDTFSIISDVDNGYTLSGTTYTITSAGTYTLSGLLNGNIFVNASDEDKVELDLNNVTIKSSSDSPIKIISADSIEIKSKANTNNVITDNRSTKTSDNENLGEGAINAKCDLKFTGSGVLVITGNYNNGIHTTKDLKIKSTSIKVTAYNNAIKGKDSVSIESGNIFAISTNGDGIETSNTDISSKGTQRGTITITGGTLNVYAAGDAIQAAYNFDMKQGEDSTIIPALNIFTGSYSSYTSSSASTTSYKGIKVKNELNISYGKIILKTYDDGLHADYGTTLENGSTGTGKINISGGSITSNVYSPTTTSGFGWGRQQTVSGADGIHADNTLSITGGTVNISSAYEGLESNHIIISGGSTTIYATDDSINASKKINETPSILVSGGKLDITVSSGDVDGIDSNGTFKQTGGLIITRGAPQSNSSMSSGLDCDGSASVTGGTFIILGALETTPTLGFSVYTLNFGGTSSSSGFGRGPNSNTSSTTLASGTWTLSDLDIEIVLENTYYGCHIYSNGLTKGTSYTLSSGSNTLTATAS